MSIYRSILQNPDQFLMTQEQVNKAIATFFENKGFSVTFGVSNNEIDVIAELGSYKFIIESRGNQAIKHAGTDKVFDSSQLTIHMAEQIEQIMRFQQQYNCSNTVFFIIGNPNIPKIKDRISRIDKALDKLDIIQAWVEEDGSVKFEGKNAFLLELGFNKN